MRDIIRLRDRYLRDPFERQIGNLASDFSRLEWLCNHSEDPINCDDLLREIEYFTEWSVEGEGPLQTKETLVDLQVRVAMWRRIWPRLGSQSQFRNAVAREAHAWSQKLLKLRITS